jgi:hypothetical protein
MMNLINKFRKPEVYIQVVHKLSPEAYRALETVLETPHINSNTSDGQAFYKLGVQQTLKQLREGFVVGS